MPADIAPLVYAWETPGRKSFKLRRSDGSIETLTRPWEIFVRDVDFPVSTPRKLADLVHAVETDRGWSGQTLYPKKGIQEWVKITCSPSRRRDVLSELDRLQLKTWEADVPPLQRYLSQSEDVLLHPSKMRILAFDLEVDDTVPFQLHYAGQARILSASWEDWSTGEHQTRLLEADSDEAEVALIDWLLEKISEAHIVTGWNCGEPRVVRDGDRPTGYDLPVLRARCDALGIRFWWSSICALDSLQAWRKYFKRGESGDQTKSFALAEIGANVLGEKKIDLQDVLRKKGHTFPSVGIRYAWEHEKEELAKYNRKDVRLLKVAEDRKHFLALQITLARLCRVLPNNRSFHASYCADGVFMRLGFKRGFHFPNKHQPDGTEEKAQGAWNIKPKTGSHEAMHMLDFSAQYPSLIRTANISLETLIGGEYTSEEYTGECSDLPTGARFRTDFVGIVPFAIRMFLAQRMKLKAKVKEAKDTKELVDRTNASDVLKIFCNSIYGLMLEKYGRLYSKPCGEAVTTGGRSLLKIGMGAIEADGGLAVMGDTDGIGGTGYEPTKAMKRVETDSASWARRHGFKETDFVVEHETTFDKFVCSAKKRYVGLVRPGGLYKGAHLTEGKIEVKGFEYMRSDSMKIVRDVQGTLFHLWADDFTASEIAEHIEQVRERFLANQYALEDVIRYQALSKPVSEYKTKAGHVVVAEWMQSQGRDVFVGMKIPYVVVGKQGSRKLAVHPDQYEGKYAGAILWKDIVFPALARFVEHAWPDYPWSTLLDTTKQTSLWDDVPVPEKKLIVYERIEIHLQPGATKQTVLQVQRVLSEHGGSIPVVIVVVDAQEEIDLSHDWSCSPGCIEALLGIPTVVVDAITRG